MPKKTKKSKGRIVAVSGAFDPIHIGHIRHMQEAKKLGDSLVVILNNDHWLRAKKGKEFMSEQERKEIVEALACVDKVIISSHPKNTKDMSVCKDLAKIKPHIFAKGGDRDEKNAENPESSLYKDIRMCKTLGIEMIFNVGKGGKIQSSSDLLKNYQKSINKKAEKLLKKYHQHNRKK